MKRAFTLIELLVVIAIIGLLSTIAVVVMDKSRIAARDVKRKSDLRQIKLALDLYYDDNGHFPVVASPWACSATTDLDTCSNARWLSLQTMLQTYITVLPADPINKNITDPTFQGNFTYAYYSNASGSKYDLIANLENTSDPDRCASRGYRDNVYLDGSYYFCDPFSPTVPPARSPMLYVDHQGN